MQAAGGSLLLDCGPGWLERFLGAGLDPAGLEAVVLSHLHFDHAMGLADLLTRWAFEGFTLPAIYGPRDVEDYAAGALAFARTQHRYLSGRQLGRLETVPVRRVRPGAGVEIGGASLRPVEVPHASYLECLGWRLEAEGRTLVYSGDTRPAPEVLGALAEGADVLIHEAFTEQALTAHTAGFSPGAVGGDAGGVFQHAQSAGASGEAGGGDGGAAAGADAPAGGGIGRGAGGGGVEALRGGDRGGPGWAVVRGVGVGKCGS